MRNFASGLTLDGTYVTQAVSAKIKVHAPETEVRDRDAEMQQAMAELYELNSVNESAANIYWKGTTPVSTFLANRKHSNGINCFDIAVNGPEQLVFTQENNSGKLVRLWLDKDTNVTARIRYINSPSHPVSWHLEIYRNERLNDRWRGRKISEHYVHRTVTNESELTVAKWVAIWFARLSQ